MVNILSENATESHRTLARNVGASMRELVDEDQAPLQGRQLRQEAWEDLPIFNDCGYGESRSHPNPTVTVST